MYRQLAEQGLTELILCLLFAGFMLIEREHPSVLTYFAVGFALVAIASFLYSMRVRSGAGERYAGGELEALPHIQRDISSMPAGSTISICGTGVTAIVYAANEVYQALKRGVNFDVYLIHPVDFLVERLADMEPDFEDRVFNPITLHLKSQESIRERLGPDWTDGILQTLKANGKLCPVHEGKELPCSLHSRMICTSAEIWKRVAQRIVRNDPSARPGRLRICYYRLIPFIKAWRFQGEDRKPLYYITDYLQYPGVGIDNPIRRVEKREKLNQHDRNAPGFINIDRVDAHFDLIGRECEVWELKFEQPLEEVHAGPESKEQKLVNRKPDKASTSRGSSTSAEVGSKTRKAGS